LPADGTLAGRHPREDIAKPAGEQHYIIFLPRVRHVRTLPEPEAILGAGGVLCLRSISAAGARTLLVLPPHFVDMREVKADRNACKLVIVSARTTALLPFAPCGPADSSFSRAIAA
jgi:hypothetical protein